MIKSLTITDQLDGQMGSLMSTESKTSMQWFVLLFSFNTTPRNQQQDQVLLKLDGILKFPAMKRKQNIT